VSASSSTSPTLVIIVGPIASGKSTLAARLGVRLRAAGRPVAVVDVDDVVDTIGGFGGFGGLTPARFRQAQRVHGTLVGAWLTQGVHVVAHGPFYDSDEIDALLHAVPEGVEGRWVHLHTSYQTALERVTDDPDRLLSKDPERLRRAYERADALRPTLPAAEWTFDTNDLSVDVITERVAAHLFVATL
jgi:shikimate kinase